MEQTVTIPLCPPTPNDTVPMLVVVAVFLIGGWLLRRWRKKQRSNQRRP